ncbi:MAG: cytochrome c-552 precursor [Deltaproteobacteria bacterium]|nr:cytochrome c-552 precursor [Deltaproteobacteria bacterium]
MPAFILIMGLFAPAGAGAIDWAAVPEREVRVFHTGQASYEWMLVEADHSGGPKIRKGKTCVDCHADEEQKIGELIAKGEKAEPEPERVSLAWSPIRVQFARDSERLYVRLRWEASGRGSQKSRVSLLFDDGSVSAVALTGCWSACHADLPEMPHANGGAELTKYLVASRTKVGRRGGGENYKAAAELDALLDEGKFLEFWSAELKAGAAPVVTDGWVLEKRHERAAPQVTAEGGRVGDDWIVVVSRTLAAPGSDSKAFVTDRTYTFGISVHDGDDDGRFHRVSLEHRLALDGREADFNAGMQ